MLKKPQPNPTLIPQKNYVMTEVFLTDNNLSVDMITIGIIIILYWILYPNDIWNKDNNKKENFPLIINTSYCSLQCR